MKRDILKTLTLENKLEFVKFLLIYGCEPVIISSDLQGLSEDELLDNQLGVLEDEAKQIHFDVKIEDFETPVEWVESFEEYYHKQCEISDYRKYLNQAYRNFN